MQAAGCQSSVKEMRVVDHQWQLSEPVLEQVVPASREWTAEGEIGTISSTHTPATLHLLLSTGALLDSGCLGI